MKFKRIIKEIFPGNKWNFEDMDEKELWQYLQNNDITDIGQITKKQKQWLMKWIRKDLIFRHKDKLLPRMNTLYSRNKFGNYLPYK